MGIQTPIVCVEYDGKYWLVDGLHRLDEAKLKGEAQVPLAIIPGGPKDVLLRNLVLNRLRGKTKASEMVKVIKELLTTYALTLDEVAVKTGLAKSYVDKLLAIGNAHEEVWKALDAEVIGVGHAYEISRVPKQDSQVRLLAIQKNYGMSVEDLHDVCAETIRILQDRSRQESGALTKPETTLPPATIKCHFCEVDRPLERVRGYNVCMHCFAVAYDEIQKRKAEIEAKYKAELQIAREAAAAEPGRGPGVS
jgi:ParB-like chromosome segregation protein Spo0J